MHIVDWNAVQIDIMNPHDCNIAISQFICHSSRELNFVKCIYFIYLFDVMMTTEVRQFR